MATDKRESASSLHFCRHRRHLEPLLMVEGGCMQSEIEGAIKRTGRMDDRYLVLPPDSDRRLTILEGGVS